MQVCKLTTNKLRTALDIIWEVFEKYEAPMYEEMGIKTFRHFIEFHNMVEKIESGEMIFWACYEKTEMVGVCAIRVKEQHLSLLFVKEEHHHKGIAARLVNIATDYCKNNNPRVNAITVNSSPYAVGFYERVGFEALDVQQKKDGVLYTPMRRRF